MKTEAQKLAHKKYRTSPNGKLTKSLTDKKYQKTIKGRYRNAKSISSRRPNMIWSICFEDYETLLSKGCFYCKDLLSKLSEDTGVGLDRIDNNIKEYRLDNVLPCCKVCNQIRGQYLTIPETLAAVQAVIKHREP